MSKLEMFAMMTAKGVQIGYVPGGFGGLSKADIAAACHDLPHYVYKLLCAKYCYAERDTSEAKKAEMHEGMYLIALSLIKSGDLNPEQAGQTAKAICHRFVSANRCQCCGGRGEVRQYQTCRNIIQCPECGWTGRYTQKPGSSLFDVLLSGLYEFESIAERKLKERLV